MGYPLEFHLFLVNVSIAYNFKIKHHKDSGPTLLGPLMNNLQTDVKVKGQISVLIFDLS